MIYQQRQNMTGNARFNGLDWLRGVAAIAVMIFHYQIADSTRWAPRGYLAVDFFFALSGMVMGAAYEKRLSAGLRLSDFMLKVRLPRLYPLLLLSTCAGCAAAYLAHQLPASPNLSFLSQIFLIPAVSGGRTLYPYDIATWSILFELFANACHVLFLRRMGTAGLTGVMAASAVMLVLCGHHFGTLDLGARTTTAVGAVARVGYSYTAGVLIWRFHQKHRLPRIPGGLAVATAGLIACLTCPLTHQNAIDLSMDMGAIIFGFPALIIASLKSVDSLRTNSIFSWIGEMSYPLYLLHDPVHVWLSRQLGATPSAQIALASAITAICLSWVSLVFYDIPIRTALQASIRRRQNLHREKPSPTTIKF
ncbi:hypothetical protein HK28_13245 [Acetobacter sp. DsW_063]|nr:hypothetical protein HK28_13245 [Acetobacter sp. DsW_063]